MKTMSPEEAMVAAAQQSLDAAKAYRENPRSALALRTASTAATIASTVANAAIKKREKTLVLPGQPNVSNANFNKLQMQGYLESQRVIDNNLQRKLNRIKRL